MTSKHEWKARAKAATSEANVLRRHLEAADLQTDAAEASVALLESEVLRKATRFRLVLTALGRSDAPPPAAITKARRICREELDS